MATFTFGRRSAKTGHPLGLVDVFSKLIETAIASIGERFSSGSAASSQPASGASAKAIAEARALRRLADSQRKVSPGFAADLHAAADRHEWNRQI